MKRILVLVFWGLSCGTAYAQSCAQILRLATSSYDQGRLHELPGLLKKCLDDPNGFTKTDRVTAYKLLTLSYIYLEEPEKADSAMINLLKTDHFFEPNQAVDPAEFIGLYKTFRTKPVFSWGLKGGANLTQPNVTSNYYIGNNAKGKGQTTGQIGFQIGGVIEKALFQSWKKSTWRKFTLAPEILFVSRSIDYTNTPFLKYGTGNDPEAQTDLKSPESQSWLELNVMLQYRLKPTSKFDPFIAIGPGIGFLISSSIAANTTRGTTGNVVSGANLDLTSSYKKLVYSVSAGAGARHRFGQLYATLEIRYQYGLVNIVNEVTRYNSELALDYAGVLNDYTINNIGLLVGVSVPVFKPQKLHKKKK
jgi:hypothetical protein